MNDYAYKIKKPFLPKELTEVTGHPESLIMDDCILSSNIFSNYCIPPDTEAQGVELIQCYLNKCALDNSRLSNALFRSVKFDNCAMVNSDFNHSKLERVEFNTSKLLGMSLESCSGADLLFSNSNCRYTNFRSVKFKSVCFVGCNLRDADFQGADIRGVVFHDCDLREAQFSFSQLNGTNLCRSNIEGIRVQPESLSGTIVDYHQAAYLGAKLLKLKIK